MTPELLEQVKRSIEGVEDKNLKQWAKDVKLDFMYDIVYRLFCKDVHTDPRVLERYLMFRDDGEVSGLIWGPSSEKDIGPELLEASKIQTLAMDAIGHLFELNIKEKIKGFWAEMAGLVAIAE